MDKCREEFEKQKYWIGLFRDAVDFDEELGRYVLNGQRKLYAFHLDSFNEKWAIWQEAWQHQQAKVEELKATIKGNHGRIAELERLNRVKAQAIIDLHQEITELKASHHGEVIGHEVHFKKIKQERDELQKRVDALTLALDQIAYPIPHMQKEAELNGCELNGYWAVKMSEDHTYSKDIARRALEKEQALKGEGQ